MVFVISSIALTSSVSSSLDTVGNTGEVCVQSLLSTDSFNTKEERANIFPVLQRYTCFTGVLAQV